MRDFQALPEIKCPVCSNKAVFVERKPYCPQCGWAVGAVRRHLKRRARLELLGLPLALVLDYSYGPAWPVVVVVATTVMLARTAFRLWRLPKNLPQPGTDSSAPPPIFAAPTFVLQRRTLQEALDSSGAVLFEVGLPAFIAFTWLGSGFVKLRPEELNRQNLGMVVIWLYLVGTAAWNVIKRTRAAMREMRLRNGFQVASGLVVEQESSWQGVSTIRYRFTDYLGQQQEGAGTDFSRVLYEDMRTLVLYDPNDSRSSMPIVSLTLYKAVDKAPG